MFKQHCTVVIRIELASRENRLSALDYSVVGGEMFTARRVFVVEFAFGFQTFLSVENAMSIMLCFPR